MSNAKVDAYIGSGGYERHFLYVIKCGPYFKVGMASDLKRRLEELACATPFKLKLVMYRSVPRVHVRFVEMSVHRSIAQWRHFGEWFSAPLAEIKAAAKKAIADVPARDRALRERWTKQDGEKYVGKAKIDA